MQSHPWFTSLQQHARIHWQHAQLQQRIRPPQLLIVNRSITCVMAITKPAPPPLY